MNEHVGRNSNIMEYLTMMMINKLVRLSLSEISFLTLLRKTPNSTVTSGFPQGAI